MSSNSPTSFRQLFLAAAAATAALASSIGSAPAVQGGRTGTAADDNDSYRGEGIDTAAEAKAGIPLGEHTAAEGALEPSRITDGGGTADDAEARDRSRAP